MRTHNHRGRPTLGRIVATAALSLLPCVAAGGPAARDASRETRRVERARPAARAHRVPSFSRQTGLACSACHYQFPQLTPFGRLFKLNGYTLSGLRSIGAPGDSAAQSLKLAPIPPVSAMVVASLSQLARSEAGTQNATVAFPQELSAFLAGQVAPKVGAFVQLTYASDEGRLGIDNAEVRFAGHHEVGTRDLLYGLTLHNNPTMQDVWNTTPTWSYPFVSSASEPTPAAAALVDGPLAQQVLGVGAYSLWNDLLYTEVTAYRSAPQGAAAPLDSSARNVGRGVMPYWRVALQHQYTSSYVMLGTFGLVGSLYPEGVSGATNRYTDVGVDLQVERAAGGAAWIGRAALVHERQRLLASTLASPPTAANATNTLDTFRASATYEPSARYAVTLGLFATSGSSDPVLYAAAPVGGSARARPNSSGGIGELAFNPWQNMRLGVQYVGYGRFNGGARDYDGAGRNAADNDALLVYLWFAF